jgi:PAS domain S-box-containing protein
VVKGETLLSVAEYYSVYFWKVMTMDSLLHDIRINEERFRKIFDESPLGMAMVGRDNRFIRVNDRLCAMVGYSREELTKLTFLDITHPDYVERDAQGARSLYEETIPVYRAEKRYIKKNGDLIWVSITASAIHDDQGRILNHIAMIADIDDEKRTEVELQKHREHLEKLVEERTTELEAANRQLQEEIRERKLKEEGLRKSEERLSEAQRIAHMGNWDWDIVTNDLYWSPEIYRIFGFEPNEFGATYPAFLERVHPDDRDYVIKSVNDAVYQNKPYGIEHRIIQPKGIVKMVHEQGEVTFGSNDEPVRMRGTVHDITDHKVAEERLKRSEARLTEAQRIGRLGSWEWDVRADELSWSPEIYRICGVSPADFRPTFEGFLALVHPDDRDLVRGTAEGARHEGKPYSRDYRIILQDGTIRILHGESEILYDAQGKPSRVRGTVQDITDQKKSEERLRVQASLLDLAHDAIIVRNAEDLVTFWSRGAAETYGWTAAEAMGKSTHSLLDTQFPQPLEEIKNKTLSLGQWEGELIHKRRDGEPIVIASRWSLQTDSKGAPAGFMEINRDITDRKRAEEKASQASSYARNLIETSLDPLVTINSEGKIMDVNRATELATGANRDRLIGTDFSSYFIDPEMAREGYQRVFSEGYVRDYPLAIRHHSGSIMEVLYNASLFRNEDGAVQGIFAAARDITEKKRADEKAREASIYARNLIETSLDPLVTIDSEGKIMDVNRATELATGVSRDRLIGTDFSSYFTDPEKAREGYQRVFSEGYVRDYPLAIRQLSGSVMEVLYNASLFRNGEGAVQGIFAAARDITEKKRADERVKYMLAELKRSNTELEQFAYVASHDLQEPLRIIGSFAQLIEKDYSSKLDEEGEEYIRFIVDGASRMQRLINDLLDFSRVTTRAREFAPVDFNTTITIAIRNIAVSIEQSGALVTHDPLPTLPADEGQFVMVFQNLIGNAIKFRRDERPTVHVSAELRGADWLFSVKDNGIGIDRNHFDRIFILFQRLHGRNQYPGTGIGLAICKKIVERHGGALWVESEPQKGSTFYFRLPIKEESTTNE